VTLTDSLTQGLCGRLDIKEMEDSSMCPGSVKSLPLLGFTIFLISLHLPRLDSDVFLPRTNPYQVALFVTLAGVFLLILLASYCFWKQHRGKDAQQAELKKKIQKSLPELGWSKVSKNSAMVILDPDTAHPCLLVSENQRSVKWRDLWQDVPDNPGRFDCETCVLGLEGFTSGQHYWEVAFEGGRTWAVGVARESVRRKGWINFSPEEMIWAMDQCGGHFRACTSPDILLPLTVSPGRIGVYLDYEQGRVSFYQPETPSDQSEKDFAPEEKTEEDEEPDTEREEEEEDLETEEEEKQEEQVLISEKEEEVEELVMKEEENMATEEEEDLDTEEKGEEEISIEENKE
ncbi:hypothetical protein KIL84_001407, partial [Mauremys mutica]